MVVNRLSRVNSINPQRAFYSIEVSRKAAAFVIDALQKNGFTPKQINTPEAILALI